MNPDRIYLIKLREHVKSNENIYKIGKTKQPDVKRYNGYPKGSILLYHVICNDCNNCEKEIIKLFTVSFRKHACSLRELKINIKLKQTLVANILVVII